MPPIRRPSREALAWVRAESAAQRRRQQALAASAAALAPRRLRWWAECRARLLTRGLDAGDGAPRRLRPETVAPAGRRRRLG